MEQLNVEEIKTSITKRLNILGLTAEEWLGILLASMFVQTYTASIQRRFLFLKVSTFLFVVTFALGYVLVLTGRATKPSRFLVHWVKSLCREKFLIARGINEKKSFYFKR